jgi:2-dehydropantoate 2-reductase
MQSSVKICIIGAGAIGCSLAARLILAGHDRLSMVARGENYRVLQQQGIQLKDLTGEYRVRPYQVVETASQLCPQAVIFIATKADALATLQAQIAPLLTAETLVIPLINGIPFWYFYQQAGQTQVRHIRCLDADRQLIQQFPLAHLIGAVVFMTAKLVAYGQVESNNPYLLIFGEPSNHISPRLEQLQQLFAHSGMEVRLSDQIRDQIWSKVIANLSSNPLSVLTGATLREIYSHPDLVAITHTLTQEVRLVAASYGARLSIDPNQFLQLGAQMGETHTSMWYDYQKKQPLELRGIVDAVLELAEHYQCPMPLTQHIYHLTQYVSQHSRQVEESA